MYVVLEAHHRFDNEAVGDLWSLIHRVYTIHPELSTGTRRAEAATVARITLAAWQRHDAHNRQHEMDVDEPYERPEWIVELCQNFNLPQPDTTLATDSAMQESAFDANQLLPVDFDFDVFDWAVWDEAYSNGAPVASSG